jgi:hypothetical protein
MPGPACSPGITAGRHAVLEDLQHMQQDLDELIKMMPRLAQQHQRTELWIELLELTESIKRHVLLENRDQVAACVHQILTGCGVSPPSWWTLASLTKTGSV